MEEHVYKKIEAYIGGSMSVEEAQQFELEIAAQPKLKEEVALFTSINHHLTGTEYDDVISDSVYKKELDTYLKGEEAIAIKMKLLKVQEEYKVTLSEKPKTKIRLLYFIVSSAAILLLLFGLFFAGNSNSDLYRDYYQTSELPSFTNRSDERLLLSKGSTSFKNGNLDVSLASFQEYLSTSDAVNPLVYIYTGLIYSKKNNLEAAIAQFDLLEKSRSLDRSRALWYKALAYLKFDKSVEAKTILIAISKDPSNYKYKEAKELLEKL